MSSGDICCTGLGHRRLAESAIANSQRDGVLHGPALSKLGTLKRAGKGVVGRPSVILTLCSRFSR